MDNEFLLMDRIQKIQQIIGQYGEENFYISFSGGKDSTVLSALVDMALPDNKIPRVYANTGIELNMIRDFVLDLAKKDKRIKVIKPSVPIKQSLEKYGYPFKSKRHAITVARWQKNHTLSVFQKRYVEGTCYRPCPIILRYQFTDENKLKISHNVV
jgi:3'-phosphoadenosine 5'-phosphosulfate sulfotransferase (PAPS reductase)/FAD synthetase